VRHRRKSCTFAISPPDEFLSVSCGVAHCCFRASTFGYHKRWPRL